jgi:beta-phosphoglucomutase-like phosphatase (HAD superfamily)
VAAGIRTIGFTGTHAHGDAHAASLRLAGATHIAAAMPDVLKLL